MSTIEAAQSYSPKTAEALTKAVIRAATQLGISQNEFCAIVDMSTAQASRLWNQKYVLTPSQASEWERSLLFFRIFRSLDSIVGNAKDAQLWLRGDNKAFGAPPIERIKSIEGLVKVVNYLDASRGNV